MNVSLNTTGVMLSLSTGYLLTLILFIAYEYKYRKNSTIRTFMLAKCIQTLAWFCLTLRGENFDLLSLSIGNSLLFIAYTLEIIALLSLKETLHKKEKIIAFIFTLLSIIGFQLILVFYNNESIRIAYYSFVNAVIYLPIYRIVFGQALTALMRIVGSMYLLFVIATLTRGIVAMTSSTFSTSFYTPSTFQWIFLLSVYIFTNLGSIGFILLMKEKLDQQLIRFASHDDLTGVLNRRAFTKQAKQQLSHCVKKRQYLSYILFDIDHFKDINDTHGHYVGDQVLQDLTMKIKQHLQKDDVFGRYGGDEFAILLPKKDEIESTKIVENIKQTFNEEISHHLPVAYTISMGVITIIPDESTPLDMLYTTCDQALYMAKNNGRNGFFRMQLADNSAHSKWQVLR